MKRPRKSLHPFVLVIHDCLFAARSLSSVRPTVQRARGLGEPRSISLILASVFSFLSVVESVSGISRGPNSFFMRFLFITGLAGSLESRLNYIVRHFRGRIKAALFLAPEWLSCQSPAWRCLLPRPS